MVIIRFLTTVGKERDSIIVGGLLKMPPTLILQTEIKRIAVGRIVAQMVHISTHHPKIQQVKMPVLVNVIHDNIIIRGSIDIRISIVIKSRQGIRRELKLQRVFGDILENTHRSQSVGENVRLAIVIIIVQDHPVV